MAMFNAWRPKLLLKQGDQQVEEAHQFLQYYAAGLSEARRDQAEDLLAE
jgi:hypothetical protein